MIISSQAFSNSVKSAVHKIGTENHLQYVCCGDIWGKNTLWVPRGEHKISDNKHVIASICANEDVMPATNCGLDTYTYHGRPTERFEDRLLRITKELTSTDPDHKGASSYQFSEYSFDNDKK